MCFEYSRVVHLVLLLVIIALYVADLVTNILFQQGIHLDNWGWAIGVLVFTLFWFLRGRICMRWMYPIFHHGTLVGEWIFSLLAFLFYCLYVFDVVITINEKTLNLNVAIGFIGLLIAIFFLLLFISYAL